MVKAVFPQLESSEESDVITNFNQAINDLVQEEIKSYQIQVNDLRDIQTRIPKEKVKNDLAIDYDASVIKSNDHHIISIRFTIQGYVSGMAHPFHRHRVLNYDLENSQPIELNALFKPDSNYLEVLSDYSRKSLSRRLQNKDMLNEGTAPKPENFKNWNIKPTGLFITFEEAQVAPYVNGAQTVLIPYSALKTVIAKDSPIAGCILHKKTCMRNNLLTGGFIDEALNATHRALNPRLS